jgi:hypothetical protein
MVAMEHTHDHLQQIAGAGWTSPADHPDLDPAHEALLMQEHFTELLRTEEVREQPERFRELLEDSETAARDLAAWLRLRSSTTAGIAPASQSASFEIADQLAGRITRNCKDCHQAFRDTPLAEKEK